MEKETQSRKTGENKWKSNSLSSLLANGHIKLCENSLITRNTVKLNSPVSYIPFVIYNIGKKCGERLYKNIILGMNIAKAFWKSNSVVFTKVCSAVTHLCGESYRNINYVHTITVCFPLLVGTYNNSNHNKSIFPQWLHLFTQNVPRKCNIWNPTSFIFKALLQFWEHVKLIIFSIVTSWYGYLFPLLSMFLTNSIIMSILLLAWGWGGEVYNSVTT